MLGELLQTVQVISLPEEFRTSETEEAKGVIFNKRTSQMAVRGETRVYLFVVKPTQVASKSLSTKVGVACQWMFDSYIDAKGSISAFGWCERKEQLVVCGRFVGVWGMPKETKKEAIERAKERLPGVSAFKLLWRTKVAREQEHCSC